MTSASSAYPVQLEVEAAAPQGRWSIFFRGILAIPHIIVLEFLGLAAGAVVMFAWFTIVFTGRFPADMLRFAIGVTRWTVRVNAYSGLLTGRYPPFSLGEESDYPVRLTVAEQVEGRSRLTTFFRCLLAIPHLIVLYFLSLIAFLVLFAAWVVALVIGRVPEGMHGFLVGYTIWSERFSAYASLMVDEYPPFGFR